MENFNNNQKEIIKNSSKLTERRIEMFDLTKEEMNTLPIPVTWNNEEAEIGKKILEYIEKNIDTERVANFNVQIIMAAKALSIISKNQNFNDLERGVREFLNFVRWLNTTQGQNWIIKRRQMEYLKSIERNWFGDKNHRNLCLHPDDENNLKKFENN